MSISTNPSLLFDQPEEWIERIISNVEQAVIGKRDAVEQVLIAVLCGGHVLLEDVPGVGKTTLVRALARTMDCSFKRIQFTPDMLPSDITGVSVFNRHTNEFEFRPGPLFSNIVLADELNRTPAKTQAALLEAMEEKHVTVDGITYRLPSPFILLATQNPIEYEGTYRLPEAQMDRFLIRIGLGYPDKRHEVELLGRSQDRERHPADYVKTVLLQEELIKLQKRVRSVHVDDSLKHYIVELVTATRNHPDLELGASPRASLALMHTAQAKALMQGRGYVIPDDIKEVAAMTLAHRLWLTPEAKLAGQSADRLLEQLVEQRNIPGLYGPNGPSSLRGRAR
ncbi:MoxR family ATPase [Paenibacillus sp. J2TS4]|uniref:AAA family ATPase n=1 Tax=Paenibacillus sp. J2TS4 TaxID=2807194 RepID=UPI001B24C849|nr:MoxR family ATPase [Paenibacillus sp. J2TS4]GIP34597.1 ATPase [Paenibacillus sp. J2TS4]